MSETGDSGGVISEEELKVLTELFLAFEGCPEPRSESCREANIRFRNMVSSLYFERVEPNPSFKGFTSSQFHSAIRNLCRDRISQTGPKFPCP